MIRGKGKDLVTGGFKDFLPAGTGCKITPAGGVYFKGFKKECRRRPGPEGPDPNAGGIVPIFSPAPGCRRPGAGKNRIGKKAALAGDLILLPRSKSKGDLVDWFFPGKPGNQIPPGAKRP
jgi:hypothetical protein